MELITKIYINTAISKQNKIAQFKNMNFKKNLSR